MAELQPPFFIVDADKQTTGRSNGFGLDMQKCSIQCSSIDLDNSDPAVLLQSNFLDCLLYAFQGYAAEQHSAFYSKQRINMRLERLR